MSTSPLAALVTARALAKAAKPPKAVARRLRSPDAGAKREPRATLRPPR
ncbi:MAG: hypothetical protein OEW31_04890 [Thermoleophilia bacterium]|nr:hypothetical protein [Thermoleophilia bacterium]MDH4345656.1 hypothetical protein [Thermoleophilia bacterium]